jgi:hypothetical protein
MEVIPARYKAKDGTEFKTEIECVAHERGMEFAAGLRTYIDENFTDYDEVMRGQIANTIIAHGKALYEILSRRPV